MADASGSGNDIGVRLVALNLPEDEGEGLGFRLTRTLWDPYPWVREVTTGSRADMAGLKTGDCLLQADGRDLLGLPVGQVAGLIRGDGVGRGVSLLVWNCGVDPKDDPELLWSCGGGSRGEKSRRALSGVVRALSCCVCAATAVKPLNCARSHLYCEACWSRLERCALCREQLPPKDSPYSRNLVAEQVFEAIATEYELKHSIRRPTETSSAYTSPNRSPIPSPIVSRKGQYQISMLNRKKVQFNEKYRPTYSSDPNLHRSVKNSLLKHETGNTDQNSALNASLCRCHIKTETKNTQVSSDINLTNTLHIDMENSNNSIKTADKSFENGANTSNTCQKDNCQSLEIHHKLVTRLRQACSLVDLQNTSSSNCQVSRSLNNLGDCHVHCGSLQDIKERCQNSRDVPVLVLPAPSIYVVTCDHKKE